MKKLPVIAVVFIMLAVVCSAAAGNDFFAVDEIEDPDIIVYRPLGIEEGRRYPVLYLIHGRWQQPSIWEEMGMSETLTDLYANAEIIPFYIVLPHDVAYLEEMYDSEFYDDFINNVMPYVEENYPVSLDPMKTALGGISRGAQWAQYLAFEYYGRFQHVGVHSPANAFFSLPKIYGIIRDHPEVPPLRIRIDIGNNDNAVRIGAEFSAQLLELFYPHEFVLGAGGHDVAYWRENLPLYLKWYSDGFELAVDPVAV